MAVQRHPGGGAMKADSTVEGKKKLKIKCMKEMIKVVGVQG